MNNKKLTPVYESHVENMCFNIRDTIIALRDKVIADFGITAEDRAVIQNYAADGVKPTNPDDLKQYTLGKILNGLDCAWPGLEEIIEYYNG